MENKNLIVALILIGIAANSWAADQEQSEVQAAAQQNETQTPSPNPTTRSSSMVSDDLLKLRDPFKMPEIEGLGKAAVVSDLERYNVDEFKMIGVLTGPERFRAMVLAPNGRTYFVSEKMKMGLRRGIIQKITVNSIRVREKVVNVVGQEENVDTEIRMMSRDQLKKSAEEDSRENPRSRSIGSIPLSANSMVKEIPSPSR